MVLLTNDVRQHHFHEQKIYLLRIVSIDPASISVKKGLFSSKQHRSTRKNNSLHPGYLTSLVTRTNHNTIQTIGIYVRVFRTADHAGKIFIPHRRLIQWLGGLVVDLVTEIFDFSRKIYPISEKIFPILQAQIFYDLQCIIFSRELEKFLKLRFLSIDIYVLDNLFAFFFQKITF